MVNNQGDSGGHWLVLRAVLADKPPRPLGKSDFSFVTINSRGDRRAKASRATKLCYSL